MPVTVFHKAIDTVAARLASPKTIGAGTITLQTGEGSQFGSPSPSAPLLVSLYLPSAIDSYGRVLNVAGYVVLEITGRTGDVLTVAAVDSGIDQAFPSGSPVYGFLYAAHLDELQTAVNALEAGGGGGGGSGTVTSVALTAPSPFTVTGSPVTGSGTLALSIPSQSQGTFYGAPSGSAGAPSFRLLVAADLPSHSHSQADITGLVSALAGKSDTGHTHTIANVTGLQTALDGKAALTHSHTIADVTSLQTTLDGKAALSHTHTIANITSLQTTLDGKAALSHTHTSEDVTNFAEAVDDRVAALLVAGTNVTLTYNDGSNTLTIAASGGGGGGTPGGSTGQVQYNDAGSFAGDAGLTYNASTDTLSITGASDSSRLLLIGHTSQTANLLELRSSVGSPLSVFDGNGYGFPRTYTCVMLGIVYTGTNVANEIVIERNSKIVKAWARVKTAPTGAAIIIDIEKNGVSIWNTTPANRLTIAASTVGGNQTAFDTTALSEGDILTFDIAQVGSSVIGSDLTIHVLTMMRNQ